MACKQANHKQDLAHFVKVAHSERGSGASAGAPSVASNEFSSNSPKSSLAMGIASSDNEHIGSIADKQSVMSIRYHQFQAPNLQNVDLNTATQFDPKNMVGFAFISHLNTISMLIFTSQN